MERVDKFHAFGLLFWGGIGAFYIGRAMFDRNDYFGTGFIGTLFFFGFIVFCWLLSMALFKIFCKTNFIQIKQDSIMSFLGIFIIITLPIIVVFALLSGSNFWDLFRL